MLFLAGIFHFAPPGAAAGEWRSWRSSAEREQRDVSGGRVGSGERCAVRAGLLCPVGGAGSWTRPVTATLQPCFPVTFQSSSGSRITCIFWSPPALGLLASPPLPLTFRTNHPSEAHGFPGCLRGCSCEWHSNALPARPLKQPQPPVLGAALRSLKSCPLPEPTCSQLLGRSSWSKGPSFLGTRSWCFLLLWGLWGFLTLKLRGWSLQAPGRGFFLRLLSSPAHSPLASGSGGPLLSRIPRLMTSDLRTPDSLSPPPCPSQGPLSPFALPAPCYPFLCAVL